MSLAFEEKIYWRFFLVSKKRYMTLQCERDGVIKTNDDGTEKLDKKGVLLTRRDNCNFIRKVYASTVMSIFHKENRDDIIFNIITELNKLCSHFYTSDNFIITKSVGDTGNLEPHQTTNDKGKTCYKVGDYTVKLLPTEEKKRIQEYKLKNCNTPKEYYLKSLPAQAQLAERMRKRGQLVSAGSRLEYVITTNGGHTAKQFTKIESVDYFNKHSRSLCIDYMYYLKQLVNPLDQILNIIFDKKDFMMEQYKLRRTYSKVIDELNNLFAPKFKYLN
jgi:DNA polymerase elongation subunit (family B)